MYDAFQLTKAQGFDWVIRHNGNIITGFDGRPERFDSEATAKHKAMLMNAEENATELEKLVVARLKAVSPTPFSFLVFLRMAQAAIAAIAKTEGERQ